MHSSEDAPFRSGFTGAGPSTNSTSVINDVGVPLAHAARTLPSSSPRVEDSTHRQSPSDINTLPANNSETDVKQSPPSPQALQRDQGSSTVAISAPVGPRNRNRSRHPHARPHTHTRHTSPHGQSSPHAHTIQSVPACPTVSPKVPITILSNNHPRTHGHHISSSGPGPSAMTVSTVPQATGPTPTPSQRPTRVDRPSMTSFLSENRLTQPWNPLTLGEDYFTQYPGRECPHKRQRKYLLAGFLCSLELDETFAPPSAPSGGSCIPREDSGGQPMPERSPRLWQSGDRSGAYSNVLRNIQGGCTQEEEFQDEDIDLDGDEGSN